MCLPGLGSLTSEAGGNGTSFPKFTIMVRGKAAFPWDVCCSFWACRLIRCAWAPVLIVPSSPLPDLLQFSISLWEPLSLCFHLVHSGSSEFGRFVPQNERSLIKISTLETESKGATAQKSNFRQKQKSHEVLANTAFQLTTVRVNRSCGSTPKEATLSVEGLI